MTYLAFKTAVFGLLAANAIFLLIARNGAGALDAISWLTLLALFEIEATRPVTLAGTRMRFIARPIRFTAAIAIVLAAVLYLHEKEWLEALNNGLWIAVVVLLEAEVRWTRALAFHRTAFKTAAALFYCALGALVFVWLARRQWFDAYDAALWLVALATIENDVLRARAGVRREV